MGVFGMAGARLTAGVSTLLERMADRGRHDPRSVAALHADDEQQFGLGQITRAGGQPLPLTGQNEAGTLLAVLEGEIYDYADQRRALEAAGQQFRGNSRAELLARGYEREGPAFLKRLHGKYAAAIWDATTRRLILVNDRFGMKPLYYTRVSGRLLFASEIKALLADPDVARQPDLRGVAEFFTFGQLLGEDTLLDGIRLLPAAGVLVYDADADRLTLDHYWRLDTRPANVSSAEALDRIDAAFGRAVERCSADADGLGISLSGGMDARTILARAAQPGRPLTTLSLGMDGSMDHRSAAEMARRAGCPHQQVVLGEEFLTNYEAHLRQMVRLTDGQYLCQCIVMPTLPVYRDLGIRTLLRGHAGELLHMTKAYNFSLDSAARGLRDEAGLSAWLWRRLQAYMLDGTEGRLFAPQHRGEMAGLARDALQACVAETAGTEPLPHRIWQLFLNQRLRRETALSLVEFDSVVETRLPYLDNEVVDAAFAAPPDLKLGDTVQAHMLRRHRPDFMTVVNVNTGTHVGAGRLRRTVSKFRQRVLAKLGVRGYQPYERLGLWLRRELRPLVERLLLSDRTLSRGLFDADTVRNVVGNHLAGRANHTYLLLALLIYETGQRELLDGTTEVGDGRRSLAAAGVG